MSWAHSHQVGVSLPGGYTLLEIIGHGGMGSVWRARDENLGREVAIKIAEHRDPNIAQQITLEGQALAQVRHPAVVPVYAAGRDAAGRGFLVMEFISGESLQSVCAAHGALGGVYAVKVMMHILDGLTAAHERGVIHRDVKPSNILLARAGQDVEVQPTLIDFGIATSYELDPQSTLGVAGTPLFMAPEQVDGAQAVGPAADQWASAVTIYKIASGQTPFAGDTIEDSFSKICTAPLPFPRDDSIDPSLFALLARATRKRSEDRFPTLAQFRSALFDWITPGEAPSQDLSAHTRFDRAASASTPPTTTPLDIAIRSRFGTEPSKG